MCRAVDIFQNFCRPVAIWAVINLLSKIETTQKQFLLHVRQMIIDFWPVVTFLDICSNHDEQLYICVDQFFLSYHNSSSWTSPGSIISIYWVDGVSYRNKVNNNLYFKKPQKQKIWNFYLNCIKLKKPKNPKKQNISDCVKAKNASNSKQNGLGQRSDLYGFEVYFKLSLSFKGRYFFFVFLFLDVVEETV